MDNVKEFFSQNDLFAQHIGAELLEVSPGQARAKLEIRPHHFNGAKTVHGGAIFTLADFTFAVAANSHGQLAMGISTSTSFIRAATSGTLYAQADEISRNNRLAHYEVRISDDQQRLIAQFQGTAYRKQEKFLP